MAEIKQSNGRPVIDYMARDGASLLQAMRTQIPDLLPEWTDYSDEADFGNVLLELFAHMGDILSYYQDRIANESFLGTAQTRRSIIHHLQLIGYTLATAAPAAATLTLLLPESQQGSITIHPGNAFATKSQRDRPSVRFEYIGEPLQIACDKLPKSTDAKTGRIYCYYGPDPFVELPRKGIDLPGIPVVEGRLVLNERLGIATGKPNQRFPLAHPRLIMHPPGQAQTLHDDIILVVESANGTTERWRQRETLAFSRPTAQLAAQRDFVVEIDEHDRALVRFGDGEFGAIPPKDAVIKVTYRVGGGVQGNVAAKTVTTLVDVPQLALIGAAVTNVKPATGGAERESIAHAVAQAPTVFRARRRAVTKADYEALARAYPGVGKVRAVAANWNVVTLHVAPAGGGELTDTLRAELIAYFEDKRSITTRIEVEDVTYVPIAVTASIGVEPYYDEDTIAARVRTTAGQLLAFDAVDFGQTIYVSKFYEAIEAIDGVSNVYITEFSRTGEEPAPKEPGRITLFANEIPTSTYENGIKVEVAPRRERE
ncbi:MAG: baseplate J/gp47 family protein [Caldilineaceae bacterium]